MALLTPQEEREMLRDENGVAHIVPVSGGKDSTCLALALREREPRPYLYIYTPTGDELPEMDAHLEWLEQELGQPIVRLTNGTLASQIDANAMLPNVFARWCTRLLKLKPASDFYKKAAPAVCYVGLRADEDDREGMTETETVKQDHPLKRWGWGLDEVWGYLDGKGVQIPERTDCARCPYQRLGEWYNLWKDHRDIYHSAEWDELRYGHTFRSPGRDSWPASLTELRARFESGGNPGAQPAYDGKTAGHVPRLLALNWRFLWLY